MTSVTISPADDSRPAAPAMENCEVGPFRLPGVKVDPNRFSEEQFLEIMIWVKENHGWATEQGLFSWRSDKHRSWFWLKWGDLVPHSE